jgi:hypothetical protein
LAMDVEFQRQPVPEPTDGEVRYVALRSKCPATDAPSTAILTQGPTLPRNRASSMANNHLSASHYRASLKKAPI